ncbi:type II toxin-antitoxin system Phd/YefM family antitoxin [Sorangium sp. So ce834]
MGSRIGWGRLSAGLRRPGDPLEDRVTSTRQEHRMAISPEDIVPLSQAEARLTELADQVRAGHEKILTRNGESYIALVDARRLDHYHRLEREHVHLTLLDEAERGLDDLEAGRTLSVEELREKHGR